MTCAAHALAASRGMLCQGDVDLIQYAVRQSGASLVIDLGAGSGTTALAVLACEGTRVISIDSNPEMVYWAGAAVKNAELEERWVSITSETSRVPEVIGRPHLILVDASHEYEGVKADIAAWLPVLLPGGYMWFHDYDAKDAPNHYPGVKWAVDTALRGKKLKTVKRQGWSILMEKLP